jgi:hypothetical protein
MAETITQVNRPPEFIEAAAKPYLTELQQAVGGFKGQDLIPNIWVAICCWSRSFTTTSSTINAIAGIGGYQKYLNAAEASTGPNAYKQFMSPYQQDVIDTTLNEYDVQAQRGAQGVPAAAIAAGAFGGGREGVQRAEYQSNSDRNRAGLQANLLQQGFGQANQLAQQNYLNQLNLGGQQQAFLGQDIGALQTFGGINQAQNQAELSANQQLASEQYYQPLKNSQAYGAGIMGLISGYPGQTQQTTQPTPSGLQTGLSAASTLAGIYKAFNPTPVNYNF